MSNFESEKWNTTSWQIEAEYVKCVGCFFLRSFLDAKEQKIIKKSKNLNFSVSKIQLKIDQILTKVFGYNYIGISILIVCIFGSSGMPFWYSLFSIVIFISWDFWKLKVCSRGTIDTRAERKNLSIGTQVSVQDMCQVYPYPCVRTNALNFTLLKIISVILF